jgi:CheY-like chemotaxis protein
LISLGSGREKKAAVFAPRTVLVVDDNAMIRTLLVRLLAADGYTVLTASDGKEALEVIGTLPGKISLVVSDIDMPTMSGTELAVHLAHLHAPPRLLFISSAFITVNDALPAPCLSKPFMPCDLLAYVHSLLDDRSEG